MTKLCYGTAVTLRASREFRSPRAYNSYMLSTTDAKCADSAAGLPRRVKERA